MAPNWRVSRIPGRWRLIQFRLKSNHAFMTMFSFQSFARGLITTSASIFALAISAPSSRAQSERDQIEMARSVIGIDRQTAVASAMQLTEKESDKFWPLYHQYRADMDKLDGDLMKLVAKYSQIYPYVTDDVAKYWVKDYTELQVKRVQKRAEYIGKFAQILPPLKGLRFAQVDTRLDLAIHLQLAASVPLAPLPSATSSATP
jgi:hypothetical protein